MHTETIKGACKGYKRGAHFELTNGQIWEQVGYEYDYSYSYRPEVLIDAFGRHGRLKIEGMDNFVEVKRVK